MSEPGRPNHLARWGIPIVAAALVLGGYFAWHKYGHTSGDGQQAESSGGKTGGAPKKAEPVPVSVAKVQKGDFPVYLEGLGNVQAFNTVVVRTRVDGQIVKLPVQEGQMVKQGDLIAQIDPRPYQAAVDQANAKKLQDESSLRNANLDLGRYTTLAQKSFATEQQLDTQKSTVNQASAQIKADQAAIDSAMTQLGYTTITAPLTGRTGFRAVDEGNIAHAADTAGLITIQQLQPISVVFSASEENVDDIVKAFDKGPMKLTAMSTDRTRTLSEGVLSVINNQVDIATGTIQLKGTFENKDSALWPGLSVTTRLLLETRKDALIVPQTAVQHGPNGLFVYILQEGNKVHLQPIKVAQSGEGREVVTEGVSEGQTVVTAGQYRLQDGVEVAVNAQPEQTATTEQ